MQANPAGAAGWDLAAAELPRRYGLS
jgi:hypothetical protein